jgi:aldehyde:ferredoxin oxidoreductase
MPDSPQFCGFNGRILWIDLTARTVHWEQRSEAFFRRYAGGGLLGTQLLLERTPPGIDPLGLENLLIFSSSVVAGLPYAGLARFTVCAKSPLTNGIGETRCEGPWGIALKESGADAIIFSGRSTEPVAVLVEGREVSFLDAGAMRGRTTGETCDELERRLSAGIHVAAIGPAGDSLVRFASIVTDRTVQAPRMGVGAVMGSKNLKAVVLRGGERPPVASESRLEDITDSFARRIPANDLSRWQKDPPGFACWVHLHGLDAALCVNNYSRPAIAGTENFAAPEFLKRVRDASLCPGCPNDCIKYAHSLNAAGLDARASGIHQEAPGTLGLNLGITDLDWVLRANNLCNQLGLDPVSLGFAISFAMEAAERGLIRGDVPRFGDAAGAERLMYQITERSCRGGLAAWLAEGSLRAARRIGKEAGPLAMQVKGLEMVCFEPRSQTGLALGYATAPIGPRYDICEHDWDFDTKCGWEHSLHLTRALGIDERIPMNDLSAEKVRRFKLLNTLWSAADTLDFCIFAVAPVRILSLPEMASMIAAATGWETSDFEIMRWGERRNQLMRVYNLREGLTAADDTLPDRFFDEPIAEGPRKGDVLDRAAFAEAIRTYYALMGWDDRGVPLASTLLEQRIAAG